MSTNEDLLIKSQRNWLTDRVADYYSNPNGPSQIELIRELRRYSSCTLIEAKKAIESVLENQQTASKEILKLFGKSDSESHDDIAVRLQRGLDAALGNWKILGFENPIAAAQCVIDNFKE